MKLPPAYRIVQFVIAALLSVAVADVLARLILGGPPPFAVIYLGAEALQVTAYLAFKARRNRERRRLQEAFDRPAFGEDHH